MLAKKSRLAIQNFLSKKGKVIKSRYFLLKIFLSLPKNTEDEPSHSRFGIVISRKVFKKAVDRNHLKRQIFNFLREARGKLPTADYLIIVSPLVAKLDKKELELELKKILAIESVSH